MRYGVKWNQSGEKWSEVVDLDLGWRVIPHVYR